MGAVLLRECLRMLDASLAFLGAHRAQRDVQELPPPASAPRPSRRRLTRTLPPPPGRASRTGRRRDRLLHRGRGGWLLEAARPRPVVAVVSAMRSRWLAASRTPANQPSSNRGSDPCGGCSRRSRCGRRPPPRPAARPRAEHEDGPQEGDGGREELAPPPGRLAQQDDADQSGGRRQSRQPPPASTRYGLGVRVSDQVPGGEDLPQRWPARGRQSAMARLTLDSRGELATDHTRAGPGLLACRCGRCGTG